MFGVITGALAGLDGYETPVEVFSAVEAAIKAAL
jgi:hypothetical protein